MACASPPPPPSAAAVDRSPQLPPPPLVCVRESPGRGRGVFALADLPARTVVEISPVLLFPDDVWDAHGQHTVLAHFTFVWRPPRSPPPAASASGAAGEDSAPPPVRGFALALGMGSLFNHSASPNCGWTCVFENETIRYTTIKSVACGDELFICYAAQDKLWFKDVAAGEEGDDGEF